MSDPEVLGPPDNGGAGVGVMWCPFQGLPWSNVGQPPLTQTFNCVGGRSGPELATNRDIGGNGNGGF